MSLLARGTGQSGSVKGCSQAFNLFEGECLLTQATGSSKVFNHYILFIFNNRNLVILILK